MCWCAVNMSLVSAAGAVFVQLVHMAGHRALRTVSRFQYFLLLTRICPDNSPGRKSTLGSAHVATFPANHELASSTAEWHFLTETASLSIVYVGEHVAPCAQSRHGVKHLCTNRF
jgi:hypothetical protein